MRYDGGFAHAAGAGDDEEGEEAAQFDVAAIRAASSGDIPVNVRLHPRAAVLADEGHNVIVAHELAVGNPILVFITCNVEDTSFFALQSGR